MKLEGTYEFNAPQELVWEMMLDPDVLAKVMPDCQRLDLIDDGEYKGQMKIKMGPVQSVFQGNVKLTDRVAPSGYRMQVSGRSPAGMVDGAGDVRLESDGDKTVLFYSGDAKISGRIASVGQRVMESSARAIACQGLEDLDKQIQARLAAEVEPPTPDPQNGPPRPATTSSPPPTAVSEEDVQPASQTTYALRIGQELCNEFVPPDKQKWVAAGVSLLLVYLVMNWWTNLIARRVARQLQKGA